MKYCLICSVIYFFSLHCYGQNRRADELIAQIINSPRDAARVELLLEISDALVYDYPKDAMIYAREAFKLSQELKDDSLLPMLTIELGELIGHKVT
ncbi:MAG: hypothetical protein O2887_05510 [Bacteroidetes bacterium]|nr:hypothetical protein [Bacteroidota bacterium]MDA1119938.1 hypothetical protein [Bacteroidota bacterium]